MLAIDKLSVSEAAVANPSAQGIPGKRAETIAGRVRESSSRLIPTGTHAFLQGDEKSHAYIVESGTLTIYAIQGDGRRQVIDFAVAGDILGITSGRHHETAAQATSNVRVRCIPFRTLHALARTEPEVGYQLYEALSDELVAARQHLATVGQRSSVQRLAIFLLALSQRERDQGRSGTEIAIPMKRADIGDFLGLTIETVSRAFTKLKVNHLIRLEPNHAVTLIDVEALQDLCDETE